MAKEKKKKLLKQIQVLEESFQWSLSALRKDIEEMTVRIDSLRNHSHDDLTGRVSLLENQWTELKNKVTTIENGFPDLQKQVDRLTNRQVGS